VTALVAPTRMRSSMSEESGVIRVRIPARRSWIWNAFGYEVIELDGRALILDSIRTRFPELGA